MSTRDRGGRGGVPSPKRRALEWAMLLQRGARRQRAVWPGREHKGHRVRTIIALPDAPSGLMVSRRRTAHARHPAHRWSGMPASGVGPLAAKPAERSRPRTPPRPSHVADAGAQSPGSSAVRVGREWCIPRRTPSDVRTAGVSRPGLAEELADAGPVPTVEVAVVRDDAALAIEGVDPAPRELPARSGVVNDRCFERHDVP
jgi:hypothetical protein